MDAEVDSVGRPLLVASAGLIVLGAFLPWWKVGQFEGLGIDGDGPLTLVFGLVVIGVAILGDGDRNGRSAATVLGLLTLGTCLFTYADLGETVMGSPLVAGIGLHLTVLGGLGMIAGAVVDQVL